MNNNIIVAPSILAADWGRFHEEIQRVATQGADWIHIDVMDGHFVPPITFGPDIVRIAKKATSLPLDVHLMIDTPDSQLEAFAKAGASTITVHFEACPHLQRTIEAIHQLGAHAGVALNPGTPVASLVDVIDYLDLVLIMTVNPGWGGQKFLPTSERRITQVSELIKKSGRKIYLEVDGGINPETARRVVAAGANVLVAGTHIFHHANYGEAIETLRK